MPSSKALRLIAEANTEHGIDTALLYAAYQRKPLNLLMALVTPLLGGSLIWSLFPSSVMLLWASAILASTAVGYVEWRLFLRAAPANNAITRWQAIFFAQTAASGAAWAVGPTWLLPHAQGPKSALLVGILLVVCAVAMTSVAKQQGAMQAFLVCALLPPATALVVTGDQAEQMVALVLFCGLLAMVAVGRNAHQTIRTLMETQARIRAILNASQDAIIGMDTEGNITAWNQGAEAMFGKTRAQAQGQPFENLLIPERLRQTYRDAKAGFLATGNAQLMNQRIQTRALRGNGKEFPVEIAISPLKIGSDFHFTAFITDITERRIFEERLALFRTVFETSNQLVTIMDGRGIGLYQNRAHAQELGYTDAEIVGQHYSITMAPESLAHIPPEIRQTIDDGRTWTGQLLLRRKNGTQFIASNNIGAIKNDNGELQYIFNIFSDYSQELARRNELAQAKDAAEIANQAKSDFLSSMSHELRTPMNAILGFAQMLEYDSGLNPDQQDNVAEILKGGRHLLALINEVLDLAQIESGHTNLSLEPMDLAELIGDCLQLIQPLADARHIRIQCTVPPHATVRADRVRCKQALLNLLSNAVKYNHEGGDIRVTVQALANGYLRTSVADTGKGIPPENLAELFRPFNRLGAEYSEIEGTGIGLTITQRLVRLMGGEMGVSSVVGEGTTFWADLPADSMHSDAAAQTHGTDTATSAWERRYCVLCIDDNPVNLKLVAQTMGLRPHIDLITAHTPELGLALARAHRPSLVLLDINMPGMDGYQLLKLLKADEQLCHTPVIAITANAMPRDVARGMAAGFSHYLTKPLDIAPFLQTVDRVLAGSEREIA